MMRNRSWDFWPLSLNIISTPFSNPFSSDIAIVHILVHWKVSLNSLFFLWFGLHNQTSLLIVLPVQIYSWFPLVNLVFKLLYSATTKLQFIYISSLIFYIYITDMIYLYYLHTSHYVFKRCFLLLFWTYL